MKFLNKKGSFQRHHYLNNELKQRLEKALNINIHNVEYFEQALIHRSYLQINNSKDIVSNERLEFLGDAVLSLVVADYLFSLHSDVPEGELTKMRSRLVNQTALSNFTKKYQLESFILMSFSARKSVENGSESIGADALEALIGAIYLDTGYRSVKNFIINTLLPGILEDNALEDKNYKSQLLEIIQSLGMSSPTYSVIEESGPDHDKQFLVGVYVNTELFGVGKGKSKKQAEQSAAYEALVTHNYFSNEN